MVNGTLLNFGKRYEDNLRIIWSVAKVALRFGCAKQSKDLKRYLLYTANMFNVIFTVFKCVPISTVISLYSLHLIAAPSTVE